MTQGKGGIQELVEHLRTLPSTTGAAERKEVTLDHEDLERLLAFVEKAIAAAETANTLLANSYSMPDDERGVRFLSQDAVKLQWALREIGVGDDSGESPFAV